MHHSCLSIPLLMDTCCFHSRQHVMWRQDLPSAHCSYGGTFRTLRVCLPEVGDRGVSLWLLSFSTY